jgi:hypothetical protein
MFVVNIVAVAALLAGGFMAIFSGSFFLGVLLLIAIAPVGIYFRVVMMRRCRDIGWPAALPWIFFGAGMLVSFGTLSQMFGSRGELPSLGLSWLVSLADLVFMVVIGCIAGRSGQGIDYEATFGPDESDYRRPSPVRATAPAYRDEADERDEDRDARWDAAIQNALNKRGGTDGSVPRAPAPIRPATFGRRPIG